MSKYYNPNKSKNYLFDPASREPFRISRSKIDLYMECPRCFYFDQRLGVGRPPGYPFSLNSAVDKLLKKEFDIHRAQGTPHPLMKAYNLDAVPYAHENIEEWRDAMRRGIAHLHPPTNFYVRGGIDDVWVDSRGRLIIVDYKATAKDGEVSLDADWQIGYKRQMEVYQWLFRQNGFDVSPTGYFVYCNGNTDKEAFDGRLEFDIKLIPYTGDDAWVPNALLGAREALTHDRIPDAGAECDYCRYRDAAGKAGLAMASAKGRMF